MVGFLAGAVVPVPSQPYSKALWIVEAGVVLSHHFFHPLFSCV